MGNKYIMRSCYWCNEYQDMNATVPTCDYYGHFGSCPCKDECEHYISEPEVENIIRKRAETEWIPCSERLPDAEYGEGDSVLCCTESGLMYILYWDGGNWCVPTGEPHEWVNHITGWHDKVIAWRPLPKPYREDGEE